MVDVPENVQKEFSDSLEAEAERWIEAMVAEYESGGALESAYAEIEARVGALLESGATVEQGKELLEDLGKLSVSELKALRAKYDLKAAGKLKRHLMDGIVSALKGK